MPMCNETRDIWITYNGEVVDTGALRVELERLGHRFQSNSDTEVLLHGYAAWGEAVLHRLRGMFAFGILDLRKERTGGRPVLFLARDRLGIKPLYYARTQQAFVFASELKALVAGGWIGREISPTGLFGYLLTGSVPGPWTIYRDATALQPACSLAVRVDGGSDIRPVTYWQLGVEEPAAISYPDAVAQVRTSLAEAVRLSMESAVPLGALLSGGLDSSAVVALMRESAAGALRTCSIFFDEARYSEAAYASAMARAVGAEHFQRRITAADVLQELEAIHAAMDQPSIDGVNTYFAAQTARQAGLTVALSGLGGDELFGGYPNTFRGGARTLRALRWAQAIPGVAALIGAGIVLWPWRDGWNKLLDALTRRPSAASAYLTRRGLFALREARRLVDPDLWEGMKSFDPMSHAVLQAGSAGEAPGLSDVQYYEWTTRAELGTFTANQLLRDTDMMSMIHSLEVRVPLLDHRLIETLLALPGRFQMRADRPKPMLADAVQDLLPASIRARRDKQGFTMPFEEWMRGPLRARVEDLLREAIRIHRLNASQVLRVWRRFLAGRSHWSRVWALAVLGSRAPGSEATSSSSFRPLIPAIQGE
jgi:asparagine synthase (glutamine-hydrolysing)